MDVFGRPDYYPTPSDNVLRCKELDGFDRRKSILSADLPALIVDMSSPVNAVDYTVISDFFLVYRNFMSPVHLEELLISRFHWCVDEIRAGGSKTTKRRKIGEIALVRTFVLVRHWILNYFVQDFLVDVNLRVRFIKFLNANLQELPRIVRCTMLNLKKSWIHSTKKVWTKLDLDEPRSIGEDELWSFYRIKDFTELDEVKKRDSQLSSYAIQGSSSPNFRNQSVLSLYKSSDVFQLPLPSTADRRKRDNRTASMVLFPQDNSNVKNVDPRALTSLGRDRSVSNRTTLKNYKKKVSRLSRLTKISTAMKDIEYPSSPGIDKLIPPTPAKKVELILQLPDGSNKNSRSDANTNFRDRNNGVLKRSVSWSKIAGASKASNMGKGRNSRSSSMGRSQASLRTSVMHHGAMGLLSKWRKNHAYSKYNDIKAPSMSSSPNGEQSTNGNEKQEMDNFVKYVISISSLEDRNLPPREMENLVSTKFDLLSARTIEEVEYLVTLENNLIKEVNETALMTNELSSVVGRNEENNKAMADDIMQFSAMDNLNLYQTVNSIANSVSSLSKSLTQHRQQQQHQPNQNLISSPSFAALERRKIQSAAPFLNAPCQSRLSISSQTIDRDGTPGLGDTGPQRLVFHSSDIPDGTTSELVGLTRSNPASTSIASKRLRTSQSPKRTSPSKEPLPNLQEHHEISQADDHNDSASTFSCVSYDSNLSNSLSHNIYAGRRTSKPLSLLFPGENPPLKRKEAYPNLNEFTFENENANGPSSIQDDTQDDTQSLNSFVTTNTTNEQRIIDTDEEDENNDDDESSVYDIRDSSISDIQKGKRYDNQQRNLKCDEDEQRKEEQNKNVQQPEQDQDRKTEEGRENEIANVNEREPFTTVRQASGRISLAKRETRLSSQPRERMRSAAQRVGEDSDFLTKDKELREKEMELLELEQDISNRMSASTSVDTMMLFSSAHCSPQRSTRSGPNEFRLSATPSIRSIASNRSDSAYDTSATYDESINRQMTSGSVPNHQRLVPNNNLQPQVSADSSFNYSATGSQNGYGVSADHLENKYLFAPENEDADYASPAKNVEALKNRFFEEGDNVPHDNESKGDATISSKKREIQDGVADDDFEERNYNNMEGLSNDLENKKGDFPKKMSPESRHTLDWNNLSQDSEVDDPVNVALMKLEGTYKRGENGEKLNFQDGASSHQRSSASILAREVSMLGISDVNGGPPDPGDKRKSLLIETRRQTIMNIPYTPTEEKTPAVKQESVSLHAKDLLNQYEIKDPNLSVDNCGQHIPFILMYDSLSIAQQMTLIEKELLGEVDWKDLLNVNLTYDGPNITSWLQLLVQNEMLSGIDLAIARFNLTVDWIISEIILTSDIKLRRNTIQRFIHVADHCRSFQNYNTLMEIVLALDSTAVQKCLEAWRLIEPGDLITWGELKKMPSLDRNYAYIRRLLNNIDPIKGCVPFIVVYLSDLCLNNEKRTWIKENQVVNYNKFETNVQIVKNFIQRVQWSKFYNFRVDHELLSKCVYLTALSHDEISQVINKTNKN